MVHLGMYVYPWDVAEEAGEFVKRYADLGCNMIAINGVYHQCNVLGVSQRHVYERRNAGTSFAIHPEKYGRIKPHAEAELTGAYAQLREKCAKQGIDWRCWMVNLHNDQIGDAYPDTTIQNAWGDRYPSSLCVNHPDVREYANALLTDVMDTIAPSRVVMETECWLHAFHGRHHEFMLARLTPAIQYLLSLCFCPHCMKAAAEGGVDGEGAKAVTLALLERLLKAETTFGENEDAQVTQIFLEYPQLYAYQQFRMNSVNALVAKTAATAHSRGVLYEYIPSAAPFIVNTMHYDASSFRALAPIVDGFIPLCYGAGESYPMIRRNVELFAPQARVSLALHLGRTRYHGEADFAQKVGEALEDGVQDVYCYNYGLATEECLQWMGRAYLLAAGKGTVAE